MGRSGPGDRKRRPAIARIRSVARKGRIADGLSDEDADAANEACTSACEDEAVPVREILRLKPV